MEESSVQTVLQLLNKDTKLFEEENEILDFQTLLYGVTMNRDFTETHRELSIRARKIIESMFRPQFKYKHERSGKKWYLATKEEEPPFGVTPLWNFPVKARSRLLRF